MDASTGLMLIEALLIIAAVVSYKAVRFISHSGHGFHPIPIDNSKDDAVPIAKDSSSPSSLDIIDVSPMLTKYEVFLSFRGEDTRDGFTNYLYETLCQANIHTFIGNRIRKGEQISPVLLRTIEESEIYVIIFSKHFASSTWCLDELIKILECMEKYGRIVIPIFYNIDPSSIRKQSGSYGDAFIKHEKRFKNNNKVQKWKDALTQAASLSGWNSKETRPESQFIREIVKDLLSKLNRMPSYHLEGLVGIHRSVEKIKELLMEFRVVGIWGMGGIGKTTLARTVFYKLKKQFDCVSFVQSIREQLARTGLDQLQQKCLSELLEDSDLNTYDIISSWVKRRLQRKKILLVLDDVDNLVQVEELFKLTEWFGQGSRIIITSRDRQVLKNATPYDGAYKAYHAKKMDFLDALHLFSLKAFKLDKPNNNYVHLSKCVVRYCQGNPLALVVLGCFLYSRRKQEWESALKKLKQAPQQDIFNVLKLSFDGLDEKQKNIFLDLACFFIEPDKLCMDQIEDYFGSSANIDISVLIDRSLILVDCNYIVMHDLVKEVGQEIARRQFYEPGKPIRLWKHEDVYRFIRNKETKRIEGISLDMCKTKNIYFKADAFEEMYNLRILKFYKSDRGKPSKVYIHEGLQILPEELRILKWDEFPQPYVPLNFCAENLVDLQMRDSHLQQLWDGNQLFPNLKRIDLSGSRCLVKLPDISQAPNITEIRLERCVNLLQMKSSKCLVKLRILVLSQCKKLQDAGILDFCNQLETLQWNECPFQSMPSTMCLTNLEQLELFNGKLEQFWKGQHHLPRLKSIYVSGCKDLRELDLSHTPNIRKIWVHECLNLDKIHSRIPVHPDHISFGDCPKLRRIDCGCNVHQRSSGTLVIGCNYFDLKSLTFNKVTIRFFQSDGGNINAFGFKVVSVQLAEKWDHKDVDHNGELKLLGQTLSSLLPFVGKLRCSNIMSTSFSTHYEFGLRYGTIDEFVDKEATTLLLWKREKPFDTCCKYGCKLNCFKYCCARPKSMARTLERILRSELPWKKSERTRKKSVLKNSTNVFLRLPKGRSLFDHGCDRLEEECLEGIRKREKRMGLVPEITRHIYYGSICKIPNTITRWSLLIDLCLQPNDFGGVHGSFPGLSPLRSLVESDCSMFQHRIDLILPVAAETSRYKIEFGQKWDRSNSICSIDNDRFGLIALLFSRQNIYGL